MSEPTTLQMKEAWSKACAPDMDSKALSNAERGTDCYDAVIKHRMSQDQAKRILEFFGSMSDEGQDPIRLLAKMMVSHKKALETYL
jgi:hypothetical protein